MTGTVASQRPGKRSAERRISLSALLFVPVDSVLLVQSTDRKIPFPDWKFFWRFSPINDAFSFLQPCTAIFTFCFRPSFYWAKTYPGHFFHQKRKRSGSISYKQQKVLPDSKTEPGRSNSKTDRHAKYTRQSTVFFFGRVTCCSKFLSILMHGFWNHLWMGYERFKIL